MDKEPKLLLVPFDEIAEIKVVEEGDREGDYIVRGKLDGGRVRCYDISRIIPERDPKNPEINPMFMSRENDPGGGWTHKIVGHADSPYLINPLARRLHNRSDYLLLFRDRILRTGEKMWVVTVNPYGREMELHTGGYTDSATNAWVATDPLAYEFVCAWQLYMESPLQAELDIRPVEEFFTK